MFKFFVAIVLVFTLMSASLSASAQQPAGNRPVPIPNLNQPTQAGPVRMAIRVKGFADATRAWKFHAKLIEASAPGRYGFELDPRRAEFLSVSEGFDYREIEMPDELYVVQLTNFGLIASKYVSGPTQATVQEAKRRARDEQYRLQNKGIVGQVVSVGIEYGKQEMLKRFDNPVFDRTYRFNIIITRYDRSGRILKNVERQADITFRVTYLTGGEYYIREDVAFEARFRSGIDPKLIGYDENTDLSTYWYDDSGNALAVKAITEGRALAGR